MSNPPTMQSDRHETSAQRAMANTEIWIEDTPAADDRPAAADEVEALQEEVRQLQQALASHTVIDQAMGIAMALGRLTSDQAWNVLREVSQRTNIKRRVVAGRITARAHIGELDSCLRIALEQAIQTQNSGRGGRA